MQSAFNFFQHWYPLIPLEDLEPQKAKPITLLGKRLVIWKPTKSETYRVFLDLRWGYDATKSARVFIAEETIT